MLLRLEMIGRLGKDATTTILDNGSRVINFSLCYSRKYKSQEGVSKEKTTWVECAYWRRVDEPGADMAKYLQKGHRVYVEGLPDTNIFQDARGEARSILTLRVDKIIFCDNYEPVS